MRHLANHLLETKPLQKQMGGTASNKRKMPTAQILQLSLKKDQEGFLNLFLSCPL